MPKILSVEEGTDRRNCSRGVERDQFERQTSRLKYKKVFEWKVKKERLGGRVQSFYAAVITHSLPQKDKNL